MPSLVVSNTTSISFDEALIGKIVQKICDYEAPDINAEISIHICDDDEMRQLNKVYRGNNSITDVLSFSTQSTFTDTPDSVVTLKLCDIIIDINQLDRQKGNQTLESEFQSVLIHGLLHCFDYDHIRNNDKAVMVQKETYFLKLMEGELTRG